MPVSSVKIMHSTAGVAKTHLLTSSLSVDHEQEKEWTCELWWGFRDL